MRGRSMDAARGTGRDVSGQLRELGLTRVAAMVEAMVEAGRMRSTLSHELRWSLANRREAHRLIESRRTIGTIVLTLQT
jgi:NADPH:quinone reductase-like Zn-dependent oxidoreductase